jgi:pimeloyl-ACP methyl ester carboxylesterase
MLCILLVIALLILVLCSFLFWSYERISYDEYCRTGGKSFIKLPDGPTNYELAGDPAAGHTVVLVHGGTIPLCIWESQWQALINAGFRVLRYDQYGRGFSNRPKTAHSRDLFLRQLKGLLDTLGIVEPVTLVGPSFGGAISVNFAGHYPERVRSMVLVSPVLNLLNSESPIVGPIKIARLPIIGELFYKAILQSKLIARGRTLIPGGKNSPCDTSFLEQWRCKGTQRSLFSMFRSDAYGDYREITRKAGTHVPHILLIRGDNDHEVTEKMIDEVRADLPEAEFVPLENSGHNPCIDATSIFNRLLIDFIMNH